MANIRRILATTGLVLAATVAVVAPSQIVMADAALDSTVVDAGRQGGG